MRAWVISAAVAAAFALASCSKQEAAYNVVEVPLAQVSADLAAGKTTSVIVTAAYIARIKAHNAPFNAVLVIAPDALDEAAASDGRRKAGKALGPLDGIPILLKDNIDAAGLPTTGGSYALTENMPAQDSELARRLRAAGAVILGKANLDQWATMRTTNVFNASTVGGPTHNPYNLAHSACGSSNGSGIAAAVSFAAATIGSETGGSIVCPASFMGLVGIKPSIALVSRRGILPISLTLDTAGPLARNVTDAAMVLTAIAGTDAGDPLSQEADNHKTDYTKGLDANALKGTKIGVVRGMSGMDERTAPTFDKALAVLTAQGAELVEIPIAVFEDMEQEIGFIALYDFKEDINAYLATTPPAVKTRTLADLIVFQKTDPRESMHTQDIFERSEAVVGGRQNPQYAKTYEYAKRKTGPEGIDRAVQEYGVRAFVTLTNPPADPIQPDETPQPYFMKELPKGTQLPSATTYAAMAGYPHLTVPMGTVDGLPVGLSFIGPKWSEQTLLSLGYAYEQAAKARVPPPPLAEDQRK